MQTNKFCTKLSSPPKYLKEQLDWNSGDDCIQSTPTDMNILAPNRGVSLALLTPPRNTSNHFLTAKEIVDFVCLLYQMFSLTSHTLHPWNSQYIDWS